MDVHGRSLASRMGLYLVHGPVSCTWHLVASGHGQDVQGHLPCLSKSGTLGRLTWAYINAADWVSATRTLFPTSTTLSLSLSPVSHFVKGMTSVYPS
jgi:hypothetical protein